LNDFLRSGETRMETPLLFLVKICSGQGNFLFPPLLKGAMRKT
jgi:hypothetical protein